VAITVRLYDWAALKLSAEPAAAKDTAPVVALMAKHPTQPGGCADHEYVSTASASLE